MNQFVCPKDDDFIQTIHKQLAYMAQVESGRPTSLRRWVPSLTAEHLSLLVEEAFWASLGSDESRATRVCIVVASPDTSHDAFTFPIPVPYNNSQVTRLAPAAPRDGCLLVSDSSTQLMIWGLGRSRPADETVTIEISKPGTLRIGLGLFRTFAVISGQSKWIMGSTGLALASNLHRILQKKFPAEDFIETQAIWRESYALVELARLIVSAGHGGIILIVPRKTGDWDKTLFPFEYRFKVPDTSIREAIRGPLRALAGQVEIIQELNKTALSNEVKETAIRSLSLSESIWLQRQRTLSEATASLAGVDGAIVMSHDLQLLGFGAKIVASSEEVKQVYLIDLPYNQDPKLSPLESIGGTRHQSSARFVAANKSSAALVISQDRHVSLMFWDKESNFVVVQRNVEWLM